MVQKKARLVKELAHVPGMIVTMVSYYETFNDWTVGNLGERKQLQKDCQDLNKALAALTALAE